MTKCIMPDCTKEIPKGRVKLRFQTCSKKCSNAYNWLPSKLREQLRGKKYNRK